MRPALRRTVVLVAIAAALGGARSPGAAQEIPPDTVRADTTPPPPPPPTTGGWGAADVASRTGTTVVSITVAFPGGSERDPEGASGATWFLGRVVREVALGSLDAGARASTEIAVEVERSRTVFRLVTLPRYWVEAYGVLEWALFDADLPSDATERVRGELQSVFTFEEDAPHREFEVELYRLLAGVGSPWSRVPRGAPGGIADLDPTGLSALRRGSLVKSEAAVSVVGAVEGERAARTVTGGRPLPSTGVASPGFVPLDSRGEHTAWARGERLELAREVTSSWVAVAFPVDPGTSVTALEMLMHNLEREFNPSPPDPGTFDVGVRLELLGTRDLLVVEAAVLQEAALAWERRILEAVGAVAGEEMELLYFDAYRRRFRAARLLRDAPPENESARRAVDLLVHGRVRDLAAEISDLGPGDLRTAAAELGEPRILVFGPDLGDGASW